MSSSKKRIYTEKSKEIAKKWYVSNRERLLALKKVWREKNKEKLREYQQNWYKNNTESMKNHSKKQYNSDKKRALAVNKLWFEKNKERAKNNYLKRTYSISLDNYNILLNKQNGVCAICYLKENTNKSLIVDHCHTTKKIRGLLCDKCNFAIGLMKDNPERIMSAFNYVVRNQ